MFSKVNVKVFITGVWMCMTIFKNWHMQLRMM